MRADADAGLRLAHHRRTRIENPANAARTLDQRAYALLHAYAAIVEEATDIVADPDAPAAFKRALGAAERVATPAVETLEIAAAAYLRADADLQASAEAGGPAIARAAEVLAVAAQRLSQAIAVAQAPIQELEDLVRASRG